MKVFDKRRQQYIKKFGFIDGLRIYNATRKHDAVVTIKLPTYPHELFLRPRSSDTATFEEIFIREEYAIPFAHRSINTIVDIGANVGYTALYFAKQYPSAHIIALEPIRDNFSLLADNTSNYAGIEAMCAAAWSRDCDLQIEDDHSAYDSFRVTEAGHETSGPVKAMTIRTLLAEHDLAEIDLLKIDIEGAEKELFNAPDCRIWLDKIHILAIETHDRFQPGCSEAVANALRHYDVLHKRQGLTDFYLLRPDDFN